MTYNPEIKVYYAKGAAPAIQEVTTESGALHLTTEDGCTLQLSTAYGASENNRLVPAPKISVQPEIYYANDTAIGYTYNINLNGYATAIDLISAIPLPTGISDAFNKTLGAIQKVKNLFNFNNGILIARDKNDNTLLQASGCIVKNISFNENTNNWINYSEYSVALESNEIQFNGCSGISALAGCVNNNMALPSGMNDINSSLLIDMKQYKVKSFNDGWSFNFNDNLYQNYNFGSGLNFRNDYFDVTYKISSVGKHYTRFKTNEDNFVLPAWEQAKNFCQYRLYTVVNRLVQNILKAPDQNTLTSLFNNPNTPTNSGIFYDQLLTEKGLEDSYYGVYNESVTTEISEAEGSFTATYKAIVKRKRDNDTDFPSNCLNTFTVNRTVTDDGKARNVDISVNGSVKGLIEGGLVRSSGYLSLPVNGTLFISLPNTSPSGRFLAALSGYNYLATDDGLKRPFASGLDITYSGLNLLHNSDCADPEGNPIAALHGVTYNYGEGTVDYNTQYNTLKACQGINRAITNYTMTISDPIPKIAEFVVPGRKSGPIIQRLGNDSARTISIVIEGYNRSSYCQDPIDIVKEICANGIDLPENTGIPLKFMIDTTNKKGLKLTSNKYDYNRLDGSYVINRTYTTYDYGTARYPSPFKQNDYDTGS